MAPSPAGTASCMNLPRRCTRRTASARRSAPAATSAEYSPSECPATHAGAQVGLRAASARRAAMLVVRIAGWVLAVSVSSSSGPSKQSFDRAKPERGVGLLEDGPRLGKGVGERLAHADLLRALPGKQKCAHRAASPPHRRRAPGQAGAERREQQQLSPALILPCAQRLVERDRHRGRRGVAVPVDVEEELSMRDADALGHALDDAQVGLVGEHPGRRRRACRPLASSAACEAAARLRTACLKTSRPFIFTSAACSASVSGVSGSLVPPPGM